jgi:hypothetical protein
MENWESPDKFDTLCEPKFKVGLIGSVYFIGIVCTVLILPVVSDKYYGRKNVLIVANALQIIAAGGLLITTNLYACYVFMFILGGLFPARVFLALSYAIEYTPPQYHYAYTYLFMLSEPVFLILMTFWYQFIDHGWFLLQLILFILMIIIALYYIIIVPESPKWLYTWQHYPQAKEVLRYVAKFNLVEESEADVIMNKKFDTEVVKKESKEKEGKDNDGMSSLDRGSHASYHMPSSTYFKYLVITSTYWSAASFSFYLV